MQQFPGLVRDWPCSCNPSHGDYLCSPPDLMICQSGADRKMQYLTLILGTLCFFVGFIFAVTSIRSGKPHPRFLNMALMALGFVFQSLFLSERGQMHNHCPITNGSEILVFISWSIVIMYFILGRAFRLSLLGVFSAPIVFIFQLVALLLLWKNDPGPQPWDEVDRWLEMHASTALLAYGAFALAAIAGVMYLVQNRQLKSRHTGQLFYNLPPIRYLADALIRLLIIGQVLTTLGIISAFLMKKHPTAFHLASSGAVWLVYAAILALHFLKRPAPKVISLLSILAFLFALVTLSALSL